MARVQRIFYATYAAGLATAGSNTFTQIFGLQSCGVSTKFNLEQAYQIGQLGIYQNIENLPDIEVTAEKALDGNPLIWHLATVGAPSADLAGRSNQRATLAMSVYGDTQQAASGTPIAQTTISGLFASQVNYKIQLEGNATESVTLVGNNKSWITTGYTFTPSFKASGLPFATEGINRRQHIIVTGCLWPSSIPGISNSNRNTLNADGAFTATIESVDVTASLGRTPLLELGHKAPFFRYVEFPAEVRTAIGVHARTGDFVSCTENGTGAQGTNTNNEPIYITMQEGTKIDCGTQNRLESVNITGGNAGAKGSNVKLAYNYQTFNDFTVVHPQDPTVALAA